MCLHQWCFWDDDFFTIASVSGLIPPFPGLLIHFSENLAVVCTNLGHVYFKYGPCFPSVWSQSDSSHVFLLLSLKNQFVLVCLNGTEFSRLQNQEWRTKGGHRVLACLSVLLSWFPEFCPPKRETETFSKSSAERERSKCREQSGLNLDWELIPSPISLWFPKSLTRNFPSVNLLKSPLLFLHLSLFSLNRVYLHACELFSNPRYDKAKLKWGLIYVVYLQRGSGRMWIVIIKSINSIIMKSCHIFSLAPLCLYELKTRQDSKNRP